MRWTEEGVYTTVFQKLFNMARSDSEVLSNAMKAEYFYCELLFVVVLDYV